MGVGVVADYSVELWVARKEVAGEFVRKMRL